MGQTTELLKRRYSSAGKVENAGLIDTAFIKSVSRTSSPMGESFNSFITVSGGTGWGPNRSSVTTISSMGAAGARRGNGSFQQIRNSKGRVSGEVRFSEAMVKATDSGDAAAARIILISSQEHLAHFGPMAEHWISHESEFPWLFRGTLSASGLITLTSSPEHIARLREDMVLVQATTEGGAINGAGAPIVALDRFSAIPTITVGASTSNFTPTNPASWVTTADVFYYALGMSNGATPMGKDSGTNHTFAIDSLSSWCPATSAGLAGVFKGMNRTTDNILGGVRITAAEAATMNLLQRAEALAVRGKTRAGWGNGPKKLFVHTTRFNQMQHLLQQTDSRERGFRASEGKAEIGYNYIDIVSTGARVHVVECPAWCPNTMWMMEPGDWNLHSDAGWPSVIDDDGLRLIRDRDNDEYVMQYSGYGSLRTAAPHRLGRCPAN